MLSLSLLALSYLTSGRGCVTPQVLANVVKYIEGEYELFDGLVDLEEEDQETIKRALEQGHVDDDDWKGVSSYGMAD